MLEVVLLRFDDAQLQRILDAVSAAGETGHVAHMVEQIYRLVVVGSDNTNKELKSMSAQMDALIAEAHRNTDTSAAIVKVVNDLVAMVEANKNDPVALQAAIDEFRANDDAVAAAVVANTPAAPPTP